ncbi:uncharacterized protein RAG0_02760 [Rhynchosporium agropyri]|uniref:Uncharacterized protein n=1 Tax=Rhynchosporium agropyri TaxID=914238 RepID=A0A1E1K2L1_9HELO|nr:uncharacterized protein RAG0_02760 [Rhynchosporium agropyri]
MNAAGGFGKGEGTTAETRHFLKTCSRAKTEYWRQIINSAKSDKDLYKPMSWHKKAPNIKAPPLVINGRVIEDTREKAKGLHAEVLNRFNSDDDLIHDPLENWTG